MTFAGRTIGTNRLARHFRWAIRMPAIALTVPSLLAYGCSDAPTEVAQAVEDSAYLEPRDTLITALGDTFRVRASAVTAGRVADRRIAVRLTSLDESIVAVDITGVAVALRNGEARIVATQPQGIDTVHVTVKQTAALLRITPRTDTLRALGPAPLRRILLEDARGNALAGAAEVTWSSLDPSIVGLSATGQPWAMGPGTARIRAASGSTADTATIVVRPVAVSLTIVAPGDTFTPGSTVTLAAAAADSNGFPVDGGAPIAWSSSSPGIASIDGSGLLTAHQPGAATITATQSGLLPATLNVVVVGGIVAITAGDEHSCLLQDGGVAYCWGLGDDGQLGDGTTQSRPEPARVASNTAFATVRSGGFHTCGLSAAGALLCWGRGGNGQLGTGAYDPVSTPIPVNAAPPLTLLAPGEAHTCGLTAAGTAWCWGSNTSGQLGIASATALLPLPQSVTGNVVFADLSAGDAHTCGRTAAGAVWCWGANNAGQLGVATAPQTCGISNCSRAPVLVSGNHVFVQLSARGSHVCALTAAGETWCWGDNAWGALGDGSTSNRSAPVAVSGGLAFTQITAGTNHTCGLTAAGAAYCWGDNAAGQLGDGTRTQRTAPAPVTGGLHFRALSAGNHHSCGLTTAGEAWCWGANDHGELGNGTWGSVPAPLRVTAPAH